MESKSYPLNIQVLRWTMVLWLTGWFVRTGYFIEYLFNYIIHYPVRYSFFPEFFQSPDVSISLFFLPLLALPAVIKPSPRRLLAASVLLCGCSLLSLWHIDTYNDATYVTCFWVSAWMIWLALNLKREDQAFLGQACFLAQLIVGMTFMGGAIGKLTPEYLSGEVWRQMFLQQEHYVLGTWAGQILVPDQIALFSAVLSRGMILAEFLIGLLPFFPFRAGAFGATILMLVMLPLTNTWMIFSVVGCLIGMLSSLYWLAGQNRFR